MTTSHKITAGALVLVAIMLVFFGYGWVSSHIDNAVLQAKQEATKDVLAQNAAAEKANQAALASTLAGYQQLRANTNTPAQIIRELPQVIQLPSQVQQVTAEQAKAANSTALPNAPVLGAGDLVIKADSAKAFFDTQVSCKECTAKLASTNTTVDNLNEKIVVKDKQIADLNVALKGGTKWQRTKKALKWVGIGVAAGAVAATVARH